MFPGSMSMITLTCAPSQLGIGQRTLSIQSMPCVSASLSTSAPAMPAMSSYLKKR
jgi:hypothetical protein